MYIQFADNRQVTISAFLSSLFFEYLKAINDPFDLDPNKVQSEGFFYVEEGTIRFATGCLDDVPEDIPKNIFKVQLSLSKGEAVNSIVDNHTNENFLHVAEQILRQFMMSEMDENFAQVIEMYASREKGLEKLVERMYEAHKTANTGATIH